jgi:hypothetical protein
LRLYVGNTHVNPVLSCRAGIKFANRGVRIQQCIGCIEKDYTELFCHAVILWIAKPGGLMQRCVVD